MCSSLLFGNLYRSPQYVLYGIGKCLSRIYNLPSTNMFVTANKLSRWLEKATEMPALSVISAIAWGSPCVSTAMCLV